MVRGRQSSARTRRISRGDVAYADILRIDGVPLRVDREYDESFTTGILDLRRYARVGNSGSLALRAIGGGSLEGRELPPQFQHVFGGPGAVAAFGMHQSDCGARRSVVYAEAEQSTPLHPNYGCDRFGMLQAEYRGGLHFGWHGDWNDDDDDDDGDEYDDGDYDRHSFDFDANPNWVIFADAARGWAYGRGTSARTSQTVADAGIGFMLGDVGLYWAMPITGSRRDSNFFIRLGRRF
jgi:hypothetical protein